MSLLSVEHLDVTIAGKRVCKNLSFEISSGQCWGILGKNGAGKTTLLHTLAGIRHPDNGNILFDGTNINDLPERKRAQNIGVLFQQQDDPFPSSVIESVLIGRHPWLEQWQWETENDIGIARNALAAVELEGFDARVIQTLSGGEYQRMNIAALLTQNPELMLLDEPANHLDLHHQITMLELLTQKARQEQKGTIMVLHDINLAARFCDHLLMIFDNGETLHGPADTILHRKYIEKLYQHTVNAIESPHGTFWMPQ